MATHQTPKLSTAGENGRNRRSPAGGVEGEQQTGSSSSAATMPLLQVLGEATQHRGSMISGGHSITTTSSAAAGRGGCGANNHHQDEQEHDHDHHDHQRPSLQHRRVLDIVNQALEILEQEQQDDSADSWL